MNRETQQTDWDSVEKGIIKQWYYVAKIFGHIVDGKFPAHVFDILVEQLMEDPEYKKKED